MIDVSLPLVGNGSRMVVAPRTFLLGSTVVFAAAWVSAAVGWQMWFLAVVDLILLGLCWSRRMGWLSATGGAFLVLLAGEAFVLRALPHFGVGLFTSHLVLGGLLGASLVVVHGWRARREGGVEMPSAAAWREAARVVAVPAAVALVVSLVAIVGRCRSISWAMNNDAVWMTVSVHHIAADGGVDTAAHVNPAPLMGALMAIVAAPGRDALGPSDQLQHDLVAQAGLWAAIWVATGMWAAAILWRAARPLGSRLQVAAAAIGGLYPFTWYVSGFAIDFGFYSASLATLLLLVVWGLQARVKDHPGWTLAFLLCGSTAVLATWAPLVVIPLALAAVVAMTHARQLVRRPAILPTAGWVIAGAQFVTYGVAFALPDFESQGYALAWPGAGPPMRPVIFLAMMVALVTAAIVAAVLRKTARGLPAVGALVLGCIGGLGVLLWNSHTADSMWTYYPNKFAWLTTTVSLVVLIALLLQAIGATHWRGAARWVAAGLSAAVVVTLMAQVAPSKAKLVAWVPWVDVVVGPGSGWTDALARRVFEFSNPEQKNLLSHYSSVIEDRYVNGWLLQLSAETGADPARPYAYFLDPADADQVCAAIEAWGGGVMVRTTDPAWADKLNRRCGDLDFDMVVSRPVEALY